MRYLSTYLAKYGKLRWKTCVFAANLIAEARNVHKELDSFVKRKRNKRRLFFGKSELKRSAAGRGRSLRTAEKMRGLVPRLPTTHPKQCGEKECHKRDMGSSFCFLISCESTLIQPCWRFRSVSQGNAYFNLTIDILHWTKRKWWTKARKGLQRTWVCEMCLHHESKR